MSAELGQFVPRFRAGNDPALCGGHIDPHRSLLRGRDAPVNPLTFSMNLLLKGFTEFCETFLLPRPVLKAAIFANASCTLRRLPVIRNSDPQLAAKPYHSLIEWLLAGHCVRQGRGRLVPATQRTLAARAYGC